MLYPSVFVHFVSGMLAFFSVLYAFLHWSKLGTLDTYRTLILLLFFSTALGIHGISHLQLEKEYHYLLPKSSYKVNDPACDLF